MKLEMSNFQAVAANLTVQGEICDLPHAALAPLTETPTEIVPLIQKIGAASIEEIDRLFAELQLAKELLQSELERVEQEVVRFTDLAQMASVTTKIIVDAMAQWHPAHNQQKARASEVKVASTDDDVLL
jgi:hypothetical protein